MPNTHIEKLNFSFPVIPNFHISIYVSDFLLFSDNFCLRNHSLTMIWDHADWSR